MNSGTLKSIILIGSLLFIMFFFVWFFGSVAEVTSDAFLKNIFKSFHESALYSLIVVIVLIVFVILAFLYYKRNDEFRLSA
jgi:flagellar biosynthesis protein FlhB